jgi:hypothetical protein
MSDRIKFRVSHKLSASEKSLQREKEVIDDCGVLGKHHGRDCVCIDNVKM